MIPLKVTDVGSGVGEILEWAPGDTLPVSLGGTGATTAAAARTNLGLGAAAVAAILGTVSQSGGVPTGAIIQRGSNANGEFVRFADGTQVCLANRSEVINVAAGGVQNLPDWTYPATFASITFASASMSNAGGDAILANLYVGNGTVATPQLKNIYTSTISTSAGVYYFVWGKWF